MDNLRRQSWVFWVLVVLVVAQLVFIFVNSSLSRAESLACSGVVKQVVQSLINAAKIDFTVTDLIIRKLAHFTEFFVLAVLVNLMLLAFRPLGGKEGSANHFQNKRLLIFGLITFVFCTLIAIADELSQFASGRAPMVMDVIIDASGALLAVLMVFVFTKIVLSIYSRKRKPQLD